MRAYHFLTATNAVDDLKNRRLKISCLEDLNDPFELLSVELPDPELRKKFTQVKQGVAREHGVVCLSKNWSNPLLWSHYADKHRGICLGFDVPHSLACSVTYNGDRLALGIRNRLVKGSLDREFMLKLLTTKYKDWEYEDEVRLFADLTDPDPASGLYFKEFDVTLRLREIILGARCAIKVTELESYLQAEEVNLLHARLAFRSFRIVENKAKASGLYRVSKGSKE